MGTPPLRGRSDRDAASDAAPSFRALARSYPLGASWITLLVVGVGGVALLDDMRSTQQGLVRLGLVVGLALAYSVGLRGAERLRLAVSGGQRQDVLTAWNIAAALLLPTRLMVVAIVCIYAIAVTTWRGVRPWRVAVAASTVALSDVLGGMVYVVGDRTVGALLLATVIAVVVQAALVAVTMCLVGARSAARASFSVPLNWFVNLSSAGVGAVLVEAVVHHHWWLLPVVLVLKFVLQWGFQHLQLLSDGAVDSGTGALGTAAWIRLADQLMRSSSRWTVVLVRTVDPAQLGVAAGVLGMVAGSGEPIGRLGDDLALLIKAHELVAANLARRVAGDLAAIGVDAQVGVGAGSGPTTQLEHARAALQRTPSVS